MPGCLVLKFKKNYKLTYKIFLKFYFLTVFRLFNRLENDKCNFILFLGIAVSKLKGNLKLVRLPNRE